MDAQATQKQEKQYLLCILDCILYTLPKGQESLQSLVPLEIVDVVKVRPAPSWKTKCWEQKRPLLFLNSPDQLEYSHLFVWAVIFQEHSCKWALFVPVALLCRALNGPSGLFPAPWRWDDMFLPKQLREACPLPLGLVQTFFCSQATLKSVSPRALFCKAEHWVWSEGNNQPRKTSTPKILNRPAYEDAWNVYHVFGIL